jgi:hypothetical protein
LDGFFWLHIKKSAGQSTRAALGPLYSEVKGLSSIGPITDLPPERWNQALNSYRFNLGAYQFRRSDFARTVLWPDSWHSTIRLAFARNPVDRCLSMFEYLFNPTARGRTLKSYLHFLRRCPTLSPLRKLAWSRSRSLDLFLEALAWQDSFRAAGDPTQPLGLHFSTHTNPMSLDIRDPEGRSNLSHVFRLEAFEAGVDFAYARMGLTRADASRGVRLHSQGGAGKLTPTPAQRRRIEMLFAEDFDIYEDALCR